MYYSLSSPYNGMGKSSQECFLSSSLSVSRLCFRLSESGMISSCDLRLRWQSWCEDTLFSLAGYMYECGFHVIRLSVEIAQALSLPRLEFSLGASATSSLASRVDSLIPRVLSCTGIHSNARELAGSSSTIVHPVPSFQDTTDLSTE